MMHGQKNIKLSDVCVGKGKGHPVTRLKAQGKEM